jgi:hypothetical protein
MDIFKMSLFLKGSRNQPSEKSLTAKDLATIRNYPLIIETARYYLNNDTADSDW